LLSPSCEAFGLEAGRDGTPRASVMLVFLAHLIGV